MKERRTSPALPQRGSALSSLVVFAAIGFAIWYFGGDRVRNMLDDLVGGGDSKALVEVTELRCQSSGKVGSVKGSARNVSGKPMKLTAKVVLLRENLPSEKKMVRVDPFPLAAGETGTFRIEETLAEAGVDKCEVTGFHDEGRQVAYVVLTAR